MKKRNLIIISMATLLCLSAGGVLAFKNGSGKIEKAEAYTAQSVKNITTIDLNDCTESQIRNYYSSLDSLDQSERKGTNLLKNLKPILKNNQVYYKYDGSNLWPMYEIANRDWTKSPASAISGYDSSTNTITGYSYGSSASSPGMNPFVHVLYVNREDENMMRAWALDGTSEVSHGDNKEWGFDQEHIWPKSQGFNTSGKGGARGDPMHLWPGDSDVNSSLHSDQFFGYVNITSSTKAGKWSYGRDNYVGTSLTLGSGDDVFEPQDCDKGDIARSIFYMVARYNYLSGKDEDGIDSNNPNLEIIQSNDTQSGYTCSTTVTGKMGILTDLLAWHHADPVDEFEIHRNNLLYKNYTNNRNPFIDFPEWVDYIWGTAEYNGRRYQSYDSTPTGYASPSDDTINDYNPTGDVSVTGVSVSPSSLTIGVGGTLQLTETVSPSKATNKNVTWTSGNTSIATVSSSGLVTGVGTGSTSITVRTVDGGFTASCSITVSSSYVAITGVTVSPETATLDIDDTQTLIATVTPFNASNQNVIWSSNKTNVATVSNSGVVTGKSGGVATITATTQDGGFSASCQVKVNAGESSVDVPISIASVSGSTYSATVNGLTAMKVGKSSSPKEGVVSVTVGAGAKRLSFYAVGWSGGSVSISITTTATGVTINPSAIGLTACSAVSGSGTAFTFMVDDATMLHHVLLNGVEDETTFSITSTTSETRFVIWGASYSTNSDTDYILNSISIDTSHVKKIFVQNETFTYTGLIVTANYSDDTTEEVLPSNVSTPDLTTTGSKNVTVTYNGKTAIYSIDVVAEAATSITATSYRTYRVGESIYRDDITVVDSNGMVIEDFEFEDDSYQFIYDDTSSGGAATNKSFPITYDGLSTNLVVNVSRRAYFTSLSDTIDRDFTGVSGNSYAFWDNKIGTSGTIFAGNSAGYTTTNPCIQMRVGSDSGIVSKTSAAPISSVSVSWNSSCDTSRSLTLTVYGSNTPYNSVHDLYDSSKQGISLGTIVCGSSTSLDISGSYNYIGIANTTSSNYTLYLDSVTISYQSKSAVNMSNYVMYEDTNNQCTTKLNTAISYFNGLSAAERAIFMTDDDYVIASAKERFEAWATHEGKVISYSGGDYIVENAGNSAFKTRSNQGIILLLVIVGSINISGIILYFVLKKKRVKQ